jgi:hypothetical protein
MDRIMGVLNIYFSNAVRSLHLFCGLQSIWIILQWTTMTCTFAPKNTFISLGFILTLPLLYKNFSIYFCVWTNNMTSPINLLDPRPRISNFRRPANVKFVSCFCVSREYACCLKCVCTGTVPHPPPYQFISEGVKHNERSNVFWVYIKAVVIYGDD